MEEKEQPSVLVLCTKCSDSLVRLIRVLIKNNYLIFSDPKICDCLNREAGPMGHMHNQNVIRFFDIPFIKEKLALFNINIVITDLMFLKHERSDAEIETLMKMEDAMMTVDIVRTYAQNYKEDVVIANNRYYQRCAEELEKSSGVLPLGLRYHLASDALALTASYDQALSRWLKIQADKNTPLGRRPGASGPNWQKLGQQKK